MKTFILICILGAVLSLGVALFSAVGMFHADTTAWFIGGVFAYVLAAALDSLETTRVHGPTA